MTAGVVADGVAPAGVVADGVVPAGPVRTPVRANGQLVAVEPGEYDWIAVRFVGDASVRGGVGPGDAGPLGELEETVWLHYADAVDPEWLRKPAGASTARIPVARHARLLAVRLPDRPSLSLELTPVPAAPPVTGPPAAPVAPALAIGVES